MPPLLAPYVTAMRLGSGFNSYTQELCLHDAVRTEKPEGVPPPKPGTEESQNQSVVYQVSVINKVSDITDTLNINGNLAIKYNNLIHGTGKGTFINVNTIKESDISFLLSVKVINQTITDDQMTEFKPLENLESGVKFTDVYGDTFISGFQEGGEFLAIVSIKVKDKNQTENIKADAKVALTTPASGQQKDLSSKKKSTKSGNNAEPTEGDQTGTDGNAKEQTNPGEDEEEEGESNQSDAEGPKDRGGLGLKGDAKVNKHQHDILSEDEVTISVNYSGGGQGLKKPDEDWNMTNLRRAALRFPSLAAKQPVRTHAVLTKYTSLKSFWASKGTAALKQSHSVQKTASQISAVPSTPSSTPSPSMPLSYDNTAVYTNLLQETFLDYKIIIENIHSLEAALDSGAIRLKKSSFSEKITKPNGKDYYAAEPYSPTFVGLEKAHGDIRKMVNDIVKKVDEITITPLAGSEETELPCQSPLIFKQYLPIRVPYDEWSDEEETEDKPNARIMEEYFKLPYSHTILQWPKKPADDREIIVSFQWAVLVN